MNNTRSTISFDSDDYKDFATKLLRQSNAGISEQTIDDILNADVDKLQPLFIAKELSDAWLSDTVLVAVQSLEIVKKQDKVISDLSTQLDVVNAKVDQVLETLDQIIKNGIVVVDPDPSQPGDDEPGEEDDLTAVYTVIFYDENGTQLTSIEVAKGNNASYTAPSKTGYDFIGWTGGSLVNIKQNEKLHANYRAKSYTVTFNLDGGTASTTSKSVTFDQPYGQLPTISKEGYQFIEWLGPENIKVNAQTIVKTARDHVVRAHWIANDDSGSEPSTPGMHTVVFYGDEAGTSIWASIEVADGEDAALPSTNPSKTGYLFEDWNGVWMNVMQDESVYPTFTPMSIVVTFDYAGGSTGTARKTVVFDQPYGQLPATSRDGYDFLGWQMANGTVIDAQTVVSTPNSHTLTAKWKLQEGSGDNPENPPVVVEKRILTFITEGEIVSQIEVERGKLIDTSKVPNTSKTGYDFIGWDKFLDDPLMIDEPVTDDITFTAVFQPKSIKIVFDAAGGTCSETSAYVEFDDEYGAFYGGSLPVPEYDEHEFLGWQLNGQTILPTTIVKTPYEHTLTAKWKRQENVNPDNPPTPTPTYYTVRIREYDLGPIITTQQIEEGHDAVLPISNPQRAGYEFLEWANYKNITSDRDVYPIWQPNEYVVAFDPTDGYLTADIAPLTVTFGHAYGEATVPENQFPTPEWSNGTFLGWYTQSKGDNPVDYTDVVEDPNDHVLSARWLSIYDQDDNTSIADDIEEFVENDTGDSMDDATPEDVQSFGYSYMFDYDALNNMHAYDSVALSGQ